MFSTLSARGLHVTYGDISNVDTLVHAGVGSAQIIIVSVPDSLIKGATNKKLVRHVRSLNPTAKIISTADRLLDVGSICRWRGLRDGDSPDRRARAVCGD